MKMSGWLWRLAKRVARREIDKRFDYSFDDLDLGNLKGPLFIVTNHVCAWDPFMVVMAFHDRQIAFVASEHILRMPRIGKFVEKHTDVIPHKKAGGGTRSTIECLKRLKNSESIVIASEGEQTWDGISGSVVASTGKLLKKSGASIVTLRFEGGYLAKPRWADNVRRGKVHLKYVNTYTADDVAKMTPEEIKENINRDLYFNIWEWQRKAERDSAGDGSAADGGGEPRDAEGMHRYIPKSGGLADGIERLLFMCPSCKKIGKLTSRGDELFCECGFKTAVLDTGFFSSAEPFETIAEWNAWQEGELKALLVSEESGLSDEVVCVADGESLWCAGVFGDSGATLVEVKNGHDERIVASGRLALIRSGEELYIRVGDAQVGAVDGSVGGDAGCKEDGACFALSGIEHMTMILYNRIVFSSNDVYYEIRPDDMKGRMNLRKYIVAWKLRGGREE